MKMVLVAAALIVAVLAVTLGIKFFGSYQQAGSDRSISDSVSPAGAGGTQH